MPFEKKHKRYGDESASSLDPTATHHVCVENLPIPPHLVKINFVVQTGGVQTQEWALLETSVAESLRDAVRGLSKSTEPAQRVFAIPDSDVQTEEEERAVEFAGSINSGGVKIELSHSVEPWNGLVLGKDSLVRFANALAHCIKKAQTANSE